MGDQESRSYDIVRAFLAGVGAGLGYFLGIIVGADIVGKGIADLIVICAACSAWSGTIGYAIGSLGKAVGGRTGRVVTGSLTGGVLSGFLWYLMRPPLAEAVALISIGALIGAIVAVVIVVVRALSSRPSTEVPSSSHGPSTSKPGTKSAIRFFLAGVGSTIGEFFGLLLSAAGGGGNGSSIVLVLSFSALIGGTVGYLTGSMVKLLGRTIGFAAIGSILGAVFISYPFFLYNLSRAPLAITWAISPLPE